MAGEYFADAFYWIASIHVKDQWHGRVLTWSRSHPTAQLITTEEVLTEVLNWFAGAGFSNRKSAAAAVRDVLADSAVQVLPQTSADFHGALAFYESRLDKEYSLVDCRSMVAMRSLGISEVLSNDHHFSQEGLRFCFRRQGLWRPAVGGLALSGDRPRTRFFRLEDISRGWTRIFTDWECSFGRSAGLGV